ncbi:MAG TPA: SDR family oxidoreductase [Terriglobia bacterium]|nr:SDR family oxidoreductase [Terriglobia bacterium]
MNDDLLPATLTPEIHNLQGQIALITGSSRGIGRAIAARLAGAGAGVIVHYHQNRPAAEEAARATGAVRIVQSDLGSMSEIERMASELQGTELDMLVNNAGVWRLTPLGSTKLETANEVLRTNVLGVFWLTQAVLPLLREGARVVNISSVAGRTASPEGRSLYRASKAAVDAFTRNWALELAPRRIRVNAVAPGIVETDLTAEHLASAETRQRLLSRHPLGKLGNAEEIADAVWFLCSEASRFVTGQSVNVSGGFVI